MKRYLPWLIITAVFSATVGVGAGLWYRSKKKAEATLISTQPADNSIEPGASPPHVRGPESATITLEESGDFQCAPCASLHPELTSIKDNYGDRLRFIFREAPSPQIHKNAIDAARAAEAAALQGKFWEMHDWLYENQDKWDRAEDVRLILTKQAGVLGLSKENFTRDMDNQNVNARIALDLQRGNSLHIRGTPALFLNGQYLSSLKGNDIRAAIDAALALAVTTKEGAER